MKLAYNRVTGARVTDDLSIRGMKLLCLENEAIRVTLLMDKGADVVEFLDKKKDTDFLWKTANGIRSIRTEPAFLTNPWSFRSYYEGAWQELFPHGSGPMKVSGAELPMHGEVASLPWKYAIVTDTPEEVVVRMWVRTVQSPFLLERTLTLDADSPWVRFDEKATHLGKGTFEILWGHHPAFGPPFLSTDCTIELPDGRFVDGDASCKKILPVGSPGKMCYLTDFDDGWYGIHNAKTDVGFGMKWDARFFRVIWIWQCFASNEDWPSFGHDYVCALEPVSSFGEDHYDIVGRLPVKGGQTLETSFHAFSYSGKLAETLRKLAP